MYDIINCSGEQIIRWHKLRRQVISARAYRKWKDAGEPQGDGVQFWLEAETEWDEADNDWKVLVGKLLNVTRSKAKCVK